MDSTVGWIELSPAALRRMRQELEETGLGVVDEMGVLALHTGYADRFFPGTSVLQTHPRYLFFTCWNYLWMADDSSIDGRSARARKEDAERWVTGQLREGAAGSGGIIGRRIYPRAPAQPVDFIYWTALNTYGFYKGVDRVRLYRRWDGTRVRRVGERYAAGEEDDHQEPLALLHVTDVPRKWQARRGAEPLTFDLSGHEARFLRDRLKSLPTPCVLSASAELVADLAPSGTAPWTDPVIKKAAALVHATPLLERAKLASSLALIVRAAYAALVERACRLSTARRRPDDVDRHHYQRALEALWTGGRDVPLALDLNLARLEDDIPELKRTFRALLAHVQDRLRAIRRPEDVERRLLDDKTHEVFERVEEARKRQRARLPFSPAGAARREGFGPRTLNINGLDYRWRAVRTLLDDLHQGLQR